MVSLRAQLATRPRLLRDWNALRALEWPRVLLLLAVPGSIGLRLFNLGEWSFWPDEMATIQQIDDGFNTGPWRQPLSELLVAYLVAVLGLSEWSARLGPALIGALSIPLLYVPTARIFGTRIAAISTVLLAISPWHLYWSQNARFYVLLLLLFTLALLYFFLAFEEDRPVYLLISMLLLGLAVRERLLAAFFLPIVVSYLVLLGRFGFPRPPGLRRRNVVLFFTPVVTGGLVFSWPFLTHLDDWLAGFGRVNNNPVWLAAGFVYYVGLPAVCLGVLGGAYLLARRLRVALLLLLAGTIPIASLMVLSPFHYTANRYAFISLIPWILLASVTAVELPRKVRPRLQSLAVVALLVLFVAPVAEDFLYFTRHNGNREDWRSAFAYVAAHKQAGDTVVSSDHLLASHYLGEPTVAMQTLDLAQLEASGTRAWVIEDMTVKERWPRIQQWIEMRTQLLSKHDVHVYARTFEMRVHLYKP